VGQTITVRTLDMGGDKEFAWCMDEREENPQLGLCSIRFSLHHPELFREQLRVILRGGATAQDLRIVFPMIGSLEEFRAARTVVDLAIASLKEEGLPHHPYPRLGMMIEVPSVVSLMEEFAREADCFSLGTNDFVQYLLGVDRSNEKVAAYFRPDHPAVLRAIRQVVEIIRRFVKDLSICVEMAHKLRFLPFFLGIGVRALSVDPHYLPAMQAAIENIDLREAETLAVEVLQCCHLPLTTPSPTLRYSLTAYRRTPLSRGGSVRIADGHVNFAAPLSPSPAGD
jgi:phosphotransferase system, enzyme I, PtsP